MATKRSTKSSFCEFKKSYRVILPHISTIEKDKLKDTSHSNASQVIESDSNNCNFRDALIAPVIGLFHGIPFFYPTNRESLAAFRLSGGPILCEFN